MTDRGQSGCTLAEDASNPHRVFDLSRDLSLDGATELLPLLDVWISEAPKGAHLEFRLPSLVNSVAVQLAVAAQRSAIERGLAARVTVSDPVGPRLSTGRGPAA